jgi:hypothetical protein
VQFNLTKVVAQNIRNALVNDFIEVKKKCFGGIKVEDEEYEVKVEIEESKNGKGQVNPFSNRGVKTVKEKFVCPFVKKLADKPAK